MNQHDATEIAYKNGYTQGKIDGVREIQERFAMRYGTYTAKDMTPITEVFRCLDKTVKEILEGLE